MAHRPDGGKGKEDADKKNEWRRATTPCTLPVLTEAHPRFPPPLTHPCLSLDQNLPYRMPEIDAAMEH